MSGDTDSWLPYAGVGGVVACCLGLELLGGAVVLGGLAATIGLSTGVTYLAVVGIGGLVALGLAAGATAISGAAGGLGGILVTAFATSLPLLVVGLVLRRRRRQ